MFDELTQSAIPDAVAVEATDDGALFFFHDGETFRTEKHPFSPFVLLSSIDQLAASDIPCEVETLQDAMPLQYQARFSSLKEYDSALKFLRKNAKGPWFQLRDLATQALMETRSRLFSGMEFPQLRRLQFDLEVITAEGFEFPNPDRESDEIVLISLADSTGYEEVLVSGDGGEKALIEAFVKQVRLRDPDVIEGHNLCRFDFPYLEKRAKRHKVKLSLGRDGSTPARRSSRFNIADRQINYQRYDLFGRNVVDTLHLAMFYDATRRDLESYNLKYLAKHFHVASVDRTYVDGGDITSLWHKERETLIAYALDDVRETRAISAILSPSYFYQSQFLPIQYQDVIVRGNGSSLDTLFVAAYLARHHSLPVPEAARRFAGALTRAEKSGIFTNVWHCDVRSLYPSIILAENWVPSRDSLAEFPRLLRELRRFRLEAKDAARAATDPMRKQYFQALQSTFKITINSFYGYLGFAQGTFNDYDMAERVAARGREILTSMLDFLNQSGANVLEMDTDGIYFQPPAGIADTTAFNRAIQAVLPEGIEVELDAVYETMFSYKSKNYALLSPDGTVGITGAALKSRGLEPFQRRFLAGMIGALLHRTPETVKELYDSMRRSIEERTIALADLAKTETLNDSPDAYKRKLDAGTGRRSAAYELALRAATDYQSGDQVTYYLTGDKKKVSVVDNAKLLVEAPTDRRDENSAYYLNKLEELYRNFAPFIEQKL